MDWAKTTVRRDEKHLNFACNLYQRFDGNSNVSFGLNKPFILSSHVPWWSCGAPPQPPSSSPWPAGQSGHPPSWTHKSWAESPPVGNNADNGLPLNDMQCSGKWKSSSREQCRQWLASNDMQCSGKWKSSSREQCRQWLASNDMQCSGKWKSSSREQCRQWLASEWYAMLR